VSIFVARSLWHPNISTPSCQSPLIALTNQRQISDNHTAARRRSSSLFEAEMRTGLAELTISRVWHLSHHSPDEKKPLLGYRAQR